MKQISKRSLNVKEQNLLDRLQQQINEEGDFFAQAEKAKYLWKNKGGAEAAFKRIKEMLEEMCVSSRICNYCEQSEAGDIEHIYPKSFFPTHTFNWENYILACKQCNTGEKLDKGFVIDGNGNVVPLVRGNQPPDGIVAFINIRNENPEDFMLLNLKTFKFDILAENTNEKHKADKTIEILELNTRDTLIAQRHKAYKDNYNVLERLTRILSSNSIEDFVGALDPLEGSRFDLALPLEELKSRVLDTFREYITKNVHPSVWSVIKIQESKMEPKWKILFDQVPEALNW